MKIDFYGVNGKAKREIEKALSILDKNGIDILEILKSNGEKTNLKTGLKHKKINDLIYEIKISDIPKNIDTVIIEASK